MTAHLVQYLLRSLFLLMVCVLRLSELDFCAFNVNKQRDRSSAECSLLRTAFAIICVCGKHVLSNEDSSLLSWPV